MALALGPGEDVRGVAPVAVALAAVGCGVCDLHDNTALVDLHGPQSPPYLYATQLDGWVAELERDETPTQRCTVSVWDTDPRGLGPALRLCREGTGEVALVDDWPTWEAELIGPGPDCDDEGFGDDPDCTHHGRVRWYDDEGTLLQEEAGTFLWRVDDVDRCGATQFVGVFLVDAP